MAKQTTVIVNEEEAMALIAHYKRETITWIEQGELLRAEEAFAKARNWQIVLHEEMK